MTWHFLFMLSMTPILRLFVAGQKPLTANYQPQNKNDIERSPGPFFLPTQIQKRKKVV